MPINLFWLLRIQSSVAHGAHQTPNTRHWSLSISHTVASRHVIAAYKKNLCRGSVTRKRQLVSRRRLARHLPSRRFLMGPNRLESQGCKLHTGLGTGQGATTDSTRPNLPAVLTSRPVTYPRPTLKLQFPARRCMSASRWRATPRLDKHTCRQRIVPFLLLTICDVYTNSIRFIIHFFRIPPFHSWSFPAICRSVLHFYNSA